MPGSDPFPTTLAFLQNQWFHNPDLMRRVLKDRHAGNREDFNRTYLFHKGLRGMCKSGRMLQDIFGERLCASIIWQEAAPEIAAKSSGSFPADVGHIAECLIRHRPRFVMAFGKIAQAGLRDAIAAPRADVCYSYDFTIIEGPHPAARHPTVRDELIMMMSKFCEEVKQLC